MELILKNINKSYKDKVIYKDFSMNLDDNKINTILGESGGGKSTLLNIIASLENADSGQVEGINKQDISYIFQEDRLVPWLTVKKNMELFLLNYYTKKEAYINLNSVFKMLNLEGTLNLYPANLSGGMKQRVNIARALLKPSKLILMDEPFKSLDYKTKYIIMKELKKIFRKENRMVIFVTHDVDEAIFMDGRIIVLGGNPYSIKGVFEEQLEKNKNKIIELI